MPITLTKTNTPPKKQKQSPASGGGSDAEKFNLAEYFKGLKLEWGRITWPGQQQIFSETLVVIAVVTFFTLFIFVVDKLFQFLVDIIT